MMPVPLPIVGNAMAHAILAVGRPDGERAVIGHCGGDAAVRRNRAGLHHLRQCARWHRGLDRRGGLVNASGARMLCRPQKHDLTPGHPDALIKDPDPIRLRVNVIPVAGCRRTAKALPMAVKVSA